MYRTWPAGEVAGTDYQTYLEKKAARRKSERVIVRMAAADRALLKTLSARMGLSESSALRRALRDMAKAYVGKTGDVIVALAYKEAGGV